MSLTDPSTRWWNRAAVRRATAWGCWTVSTVAALLSGWLIALETGEAAAGDVPDAALPLLSVAALLFLLLGEFAYLLADRSEDFDVRIVLTPLAVYFVALGGGQIVGEVAHGGSPPPLGTVFVLTGAVAIVVVEWLARVRARRARLRYAVARSGVATTGRVVRARGYFVNNSRVTRVTVEFTDAEGRSRWASQSVGGTARVGDRVRVRYSPEHLGKGAGVVVTRG